jgi:peptide/nickel transport system permease protein
VGGNELSLKNNTVLDCLIRLSKSKTGLIGLVIISFWFIMSIVTVFWVPNDPFEFNSKHRLEPPSAAFICGTDKFGRDMFSRVLCGSREVILLALSGTLFALFLGTVVGLSAGYYGKAYEEIAMRAMDVLMSFPSLMLAILVLGMLGPGFINVVVVIGVVFCPRVSRVVRSVVIEIMPKEFIEAAKTRGEGNLQIMVREVLPNILGHLSVEFSVRFAYAVFLSASLGFLGLGVQPPTPDWGLMVSENRDFLSIAPWTVYFPALAISSLVIGVNLLSDSIRQLAAGEI